MSEQRLQEILSAMEVENAKLVQMNKEVCGLSFHGSFDSPLPLDVTLIHMQIVGIVSYIPNEFLRSTVGLNPKVPIVEIPPRQLYGFRMLGFTLMETVCSFRSQTLDRPFRQPLSHNSATLLQVLY